MIVNYQYRLIPTTEQKLVLNDWLRICRYWYNKQLAERFHWWAYNRSDLIIPQGEFCLISCSVGSGELKDKPDYYNQKKQLPIIKQDLLKVNWSGELLDLTSVPSQTLQEVCKRVDLSFSRYIKSDNNGKRSGKPRFKNQSRFRSMIFESVKFHSCSVGKSTSSEVFSGARAGRGKFLYLSTPKIGLIKIRHHRPLPDGAMLKSVQVIKKVDGWYINLRLQDNTVPDFNPDIVPTWDNSLGMDAVLHENDYLATSEGIKLPSLKSFRQSKNKLTKVSKRKATKKKGSKARRLLAKREAKIHASIARSRKDHAYKSAHTLLKTGKQVFFHEKLNLTRLRRKNKPKQNELGHYLPNGQSAKAGLNLSWSDAAFGQFFEILAFKAEKAGALVIPVNPQYTSRLLSYKDEFVFTDCSVREYWDEELNLLIDRDINAAVNVKRVGLDLLPTIKRRKGNPVVTTSTTNSTLKEVLLVHQLWATRKPTLYS